MFNRIVIANAVSGQHLPTRLSAAIKRAKQHGAELLMVSVEDSRSSQPLSTRWWRRRPRPTISSKASFPAPRHRPRQSNSGPIFSPARRWGQLLHS